MIAQTDQSQQQGFTLVEMMVAMVIMPLIFISVISLLNMANVIFNTNDKFSQLNQSAMQTLRYIEREIGQTSPSALPQHLIITTDPSNNSVVRFQTPVDWDNDNDVVSNAAGNPVEWGAYDEAGASSICDSNGCAGDAPRPDVLNRWVRYSVTNNQLIRELTTSNGAAIANTQRIVANNVLTFVANQNANIVTTRLTLSLNDAVGQNGAARNFQSIFTNRTTLRNAVA